MNKPKMASGAGASEKDAVEPAPVNDSTMDMDIEVQKPDMFLEGDISGTSKMEAITAVWGNHGRLIILGALIFSMIA